MADPERTLKMAERTQDSTQWATTLNETSKTQNAEIDHESLVVIPTYR